MKTKILFILTLTIVASCTIQKRYHRKGFHIEWNNHYKSAKDNVEAESNSKENIFEARSVAIEQSNSEYRPQKGDEIDLNTNEEEKILHKKDFSLGNYHSIDQNNPILEKSTVDTRTTSAKNNYHFKKESKTKRSSGDNLLYGTGLLLFLSTFIGIRLFRKRLLKLTKWSTNNTLKAQFAIAGMQLPLMGMSIYAGYNLYQLGYDISSTPLYIGTGILAAGLSIAPLFPSRGYFILPGRLNRRRMAYLGAALASSMLMLSYGNNAAKSKEDSYAKAALTQVDSILIGSQVDQTYNTGTSFIADHNNQHEIKKAKLRKAANIGMCILATFLFALLICTLCGGVCLLVFGLLGEASMAANAGMVLGGALIAALSVLGMKKIAQSGWCRM